MGKKEGRGRVYEQTDIMKGEVTRAITTQKCDKASDEIRRVAGILKYGGETVFDCMHSM